MVACLSGEHTSEDPWLKWPSLGRGADTPWLQPSDLGSPAPRTTHLTPASGTTYPPTPGHVAELEFLQSH